MTSFNITVRNIFSKLSALALLAAAVWVAFSYVTLPVWQRFHDVNDRIAAQRALLGRYAAEKASSAGTTNLGSDRETGQQAFLPGETDALRLAHLQATLNAAASSSQIRLASASALDASEDSGVHFIGIQAQFSTDLEPLQKMLFSLEKQQPNLIVDQLHIARAPDAGPVTGLGNLPTLDVNFVLRGAVPLKTAKQE
jgi:Type II secretion system (T2SS), protein M subtype b